MVNMIENQCPYCKKTVKGYTQKQINNMILNHIVSNHSHKTAEYLFNKSVKEKKEIDYLLLTVKLKIKDYISNQNKLLKLKLRKEYYSCIFTEQSWFNFLKELQKYYEDMK